MVIYKPDNDKQQDDGQSKTFPDIRPPIPGPVPAMIIQFKFRLQEYVRLTNLEIYGNIIAAGVAFNEATVLYLVEDGSRTGRQQWYPETMIESVPMYSKTEGGLGATEETKAAEE